MGRMIHVLGPAALAALLAAPGLAQQAAPAPADLGGAAAPDNAASMADNPAPDEPDAAATPAPGAEGAGPVDPHLKLPALTGGPDGSPTALRGNPLPGTSTSIPTANPASVSPLPERRGQKAETENTGIEGQCDPVVSVGCPTLPGGGAPASAATDAAGSSGTAGTGTDPEATDGGAAN